MKSIFIGRLNIITCLLAIVLTSCGQRVKPAEFRVINPVGITQTIEKIDSARLALELLSEQKETGSQPDANPLGVPTQESFDSAAVTWGTFVRLCQEDRFKEAYDLYNEDGKYGDLIVSMQHPGNLYILCRDVLKPMMYEFEPKDSADVKYMNLMKVEYYLRLVNI